MPVTPKSFHLTPSAARGFSLVEVAMALGIAAFCLCALLGLFSVGIGISRDSTGELQASHLAQSLISTRRALPAANLGADFPIPALTAGASVPTTSVKLDADGNIAPPLSPAIYGLTYRIEAPAAGVKAPFKLYLCVFWPAQASLSKATGRYELITRLPAP